MEDDHGLIVEVFDGEFGSFGERVPRRCGEVERFVGERFDAELRFVDRARHDGEVELGGDELFDEVVGDVFEELELYIWELGFEGVDGRREEIRGDGGDGADAQLAVREGGVVGERVFGVLQCGERGAGPGQECTGGIGERDAAAEAVEQRGTELFFEFYNLLAKRWLRHIAGRCGTGKVAGVCHSDEVSELMVFHSVILWQRWLVGLGYL